MVFTAVYTTPEDEHGERSAGSFEHAVAMVRAALPFSPTSWGYVWQGGTFLATVYPVGVDLSQHAVEAGITWDRNPEWWPPECP